MTKMLSVIIITKNEESHIAKCLESVKWADEIIVLDSGSADKTVSICRQFTPNVFETDWQGFGVQKQRALNKATGNWVLSIDADEIITPELRAEIENVIKSTEFKGYQIPFLSNFCGKKIRHGGWYPDYHLRLFRRVNSEFSNSVVHEWVNVNGKIGFLKSPILHDSYTDLAEVLRKMDSYSTLGAKLLFEKGIKSSVSKAVLKGLWTFFRAYVLRRGFLDGSHGLMLAIYNAETTYYKYLKLWELQNNGSMLHKKSD
ncbi:MAG: glycosyltransferase family 2 protein [Methylococcaceae bacterium]